jgi:hypothetical protein
MNLLTSATAAVVSGSLVIAYVAETLASWIMP